MFLFFFFTTLSVLSPLTSQLVQGFINGQLYLVWVIDLFAEYSQYLQFDITLEVQHNTTINHFFTLCCWSFFFGNLDLEKNMSTIKYQTTSRSGLLKVISPPPSPPFPPSRRLSGKLWPSMLLVLTFAFAFSFYGYCAIQKVCHLKAPKPTWHKICHTKSMLS